MIKPFIDFSSSTLTSTSSTCLLFSFLFHFQQKGERVFFFKLTHTKQTEGTRIKTEKRTLPHFSKKKKKKKKTLPFPLLHKK